jgi:tetratricopeptide (TPR) repeat protein
MRGSLRVNPEEADSYLFLGKSYFFCDEKGEAIAHLKKYIEFNQHNSEEVANVSYAFDILGQCYEAENEDSAAMTCYTTATKINPSAASAWHNLGLLYIKSAQHCLEQDLTNSFKLFRGAQLFLKKALEIYSTNPMFLHSVAGWYEKYIEALEKVTEDEEAVQKNIDNNFKLAIQYYQKALTACREDDVALKNIITSNFTECLAQYGHHLYRAEDFVKALEFYLQAIELDPEHLIVINQVGMSLFKQNQFPEARKYFLDILNKTSDPQELADAWLNIACTHRMEKSWINAEDALKEARKFAPEDSSIFDEEQKLITSKAQASLIAAPQTIFSNLNPVLQSQSNTAADEEKQFTI